MNSYNKPLPIPSEWSRPFWENAKGNKLVLKKCRQCGHIDHPPYVFCTECWSEDYEWIEATGKGTVYTFSVTVLGAPAPFTEDMPLMLAMVDLEEGIRMLTSIVETTPEELKIGMEVEVVFDHVTDEVALPRFRPVKRDGAAQ